MWQLLAYLLSVRTAILFQAGCRQWLGHCHVQALAGTPSQLLPWAMAEASALGYSVSAVI